MAELIQIRRGLAADRPTLSSGEFGLDTDTKDVYIGTTSGNQFVGGPGLEAIVTKKYPVPLSFAGDTWGTGQPTGTTLQVLSAPFLLTLPITVAKVSAYVGTLSGGGSWDFAIFSADKATRHLQIGWQALSSGLNTVTLATAVDFTARGMYIAAFSCKFSGTKPSFTNVQYNQTTTALAYLVNQGTTRLGLNSVDADATTGIPTTLSTITQQTTNVFPYVMLSSE